MDHQPDETKMRISENVRKIDTAFNGVSNHCPFPDQATYKKRDR